MYAFIVFALLLVLPLISVGLELVHAPGVLAASLIMPVMAKWYVFWAVGARLSLAGLRQIFQPRYTAENILGIKSADALFVVRELGFANLAMGSAGLGSLFAPSWLAPVAMLGAIFYGLAGVNHCFHERRNKLQNLALVSDLCAAAVLAICFWVRLR
jgi:hypothetical protein